MQEPRQNICHPRPAQKIVGKSVKSGGAIRLAQLRVTIAAGLQDIL